MPSEITQAIPIAINQLINQNPQQGQDARAAQQANNPLRPPAIVSQIAAAQTAGQLVSNDKERGVQVPKRPEANFASKEDQQDESPEQNIPKKKKDEAAGDGESKLNVVA